MWPFWPEECNVNPFYSDPATCGHFDQKSVMLTHFIVILLHVAIWAKIVLPFLVVILMCGWLAV